MPKRSEIYLLLLTITFLAISTGGNAQNEHSKWYFGDHAGLDFVTSPPTILNNSAMHANFCSASVADAAGNLLFYTDGDTLWDASHNIMSNGAGLSTPPYARNVVIVKRPGSANIYYVIVNNPVTCPVCGVVRYHIVDMSLAAGMGSVTVKSAVMSNTAVTGLAAVKHCNGVDYWVVEHEFNTSNFRAHLLTATGFQPPVISSIGPVHFWTSHAFGFSPNGRKFVADDHLYDFDPSTGILSNSLIVGGGSPAFSPDGSKLYQVTSGGNVLQQYDLCAGSPSAIVASLYTTSTTFALGPELAPDGKIYISRHFQPMTGVIHNPNNAGAACNFSLLGQSVAPKRCLIDMPMFPVRFQPTSQASPFTFTVDNALGCRAVAFTSGAQPCPAVSYSVLGMQWSFGDPGSGAANTSTLQNPVHFYSAAGTFTAEQIFHYSCGGANDTVRMVIQVNQPCIAVISDSISCSTLGSATVTGLVGTGPFSYTWYPTMQTGSVATGLWPGTYSVIVHDAGTNSTYSATTQFTPSSELTFSLSYLPSVTCHSAANGTAAVYGIAGSSGTLSYLWTNGTTSFTTQNVSALTAGTWSLLITDSLTACQSKTVFTVAQPFPITLSISANPSVICVGNPVLLTGLAAGGTPAYSYTWNNGVNTGTRSVTETAAGTYTYFLSSSDINDCFVQNSIKVNFTPPPGLYIQPEKPEICAGGKVELSAHGDCVSYTWSPVPSLSANHGPTVISNPQVSTGYTLAGEANGCTTFTSVMVTVLPLPVASIQGADRYCTDEIVVMKGTGGTVYAWTGPNNFSSAGQTATLIAHNSSFAGLYNLVVTDAKGCSGSTSFNLQLISAPTAFLEPERSGGCAPFCTKFNLNKQSSAITGYWKTENETKDLNMFTHCYTTPGEKLISGWFRDTITGCVNTQTLAVSVYPVPVADFNWIPKIPVEMMDEVWFLNQSKGETTSWSWHFSDAPIHNAITENVKRGYREQGHFPVALVVKNSYYCSDTTVKVITVDSDFGIFVPNAFTPNGDGQNEYFLPVVRGVTKYMLRVFDRWGELLFETPDYKSGWDGQYKGGSCKQDVYVWIIALTTSSNEQKSFNGTVFLTR